VIASSAGSWTGGPVALPSVRTAERPPRRSPGGVSPGSTRWCPNLPLPGSPGAVAVLDLVGDAPQADLVTIVPAG
jgi:hypothetical protein